MKKLILPLSTVFALILMNAGTANADYKDDLRSYFKEGLDKSQGLEAMATRCIDDAMATGQLAVASAYTDATCEGQTGEDLANQMYTMSLHHIFSGRDDNPDEAPVSMNKSFYFRFRSFDIKCWSLSTDINMNPPYKCVVRRYRR